MHSVRRHRAAAIVMGDDPKARSVLVKVWKISNVVAIRSRKWFVTNELESH